MPFFKKRSKKKEEKSPKIEKTLQELCKEYFPKDPEAMYKELMFLPTELPSGYDTSLEEIRRKAEEEEEKGNLKEAIELYRKAAGLAYTHGSSKEIKHLLERRKELMSKIPEEEKITILDKLIYETIINNVEASWTVMRKYLGLSES
jgi:hypothetical protein